MPRHFGPHHIKNGYAAMGSSLRRPRPRAAVSGQSVAEAIAAEKARAQRLAKIVKKSK